MELYKCMYDVYILCTPNTVIDIVKGYVVIINIHNDLLFVCLLWKCYFYKITKLGKTLILWKMKN